jgi:HAD superfamily hydrolase (TIGR01509 family)
MSAFDLIIFDCDGVVVDSEILSCGALLTQLRRYGISLELGDIHRRFLGRSFQAVADAYRDWHGEPVPDRFRQELQEELHASFRRELRAMPGIAELLAGLDTPFCLASSSDLERVRLSLGLAGIDAYFDGRLYTAQMVRHGKPAPDLFLHAATAMGQAPERALVIEDSVPGVAAGRAAGMTVWGFVGGSHHALGDPAESRAMLVEAGAAEVFGDMADIRRRLVEH